MWNSNRLFSYYNYFVFCVYNCDFMRNTNIQWKFNFYMRDSVYIDVMIEDLYVVYAQIVMMNYY